MESVALFAPLGLLLLGLCVPLLLLYILKVERKVVRVPSTWLWTEAKRDALARAPFARLVLYVTLVLEALGLVLLGFAFARPVARSENALDAHVAVIVDVSASMSAQTRSGTRLDAAKARAKERALALAPGAEVMVIAAGRDARVVSPLDRDQRHVLAAIDALSAQDVEGDLEPAVGVATDRLGSMPKARIVVVTDGALAHPTSLDASRVPVEVLTVGEPVDNVGIVRVDVRSGRDPVTAREQVQAFVLVASSAKTAREAYVTMREENASDILASRRVLVGPGERLPVVLDFFPAEGDHDKPLVIDLSPHDALAVDDVAYAVVPPSDKLRVAFVVADGARSPWLERAFASDPAAEVSAATIADLTSPTLDAHALVVAIGLCPSDPGGRDLLIVGPPEGTCHGVTIGPAISDPTITSWDTNDPRLSYVSFDGVSVAHARRLSVETGARALVRDREGVLVADASTPSESITLVGFDVGETTWPLKASFVVFAHNVLEEARRHRASHFIGGMRTGEPLVIGVPLPTRTVDVTPPDGRPSPLQARDGVLVIPELPRTGIYRVTMPNASPATRFVPVNLVSADESDLSRTLPPGVGPERVVRSTAERASAYRDYTWVLGLCALILFVADVVYLTRAPRRVSRPVVRS